MWSEMGREAAKTPRGLPSFSTGSALVLAIETSHRGAEPTELGHRAAHLAPLFHPGPFRCSEIWPLRPRFRAPERAQDRTERRGPQLCVRALRALRLCGNLGREHLEAPGRDRDERSPTLRGSL